MLALPINNKTIALAVKVLKEGGVIVCPTETSYGLSTDAAKRRAVMKVFKIKKRAPAKPLGMICANMAMVKKWFKFEPLELKLAKKYWPGPLALALRPRKRRPTLSTAKDRTVVVRISSNKIAGMLSKKLGAPLVSTSANITGGREPYSAQEVLRQFRSKKYQPDLVLDGGKLPKRKPSTIVRVVGGKIKVLREGPIKIPKKEKHGYIDFKKIDFKKFAVS